ncbi:MAG TPA: hypothetical protein VMT36_00900 [Candidatus Saccharimonadia bacterium]|nr:hypothetical protein [Candidatus Saccharimonadia bacterium]
MSPGVRVTYGSDVFIADEDFEYGTYNLRVVAKRCGAWSISLRRP